MINEPKIEPTCIGSDTACSGMSGAADDAKADKSTESP